MTTKGKVLVLVSSGRGLPLKDGKVYAGAGYYLNELTVPVRALMKEGYEITFANPKGNAPQVDVHSEVADFFGGDAAKLQDYMIFRDGLTGLRDPTRIADVIASGLDQYDAVFVPGGHGPMIDLLDDPDAGTVMRHFHETSKPTAVLCHGPISLLSALPNSTELVAALAAGDAAGVIFWSGRVPTSFSTAMRTVSRSMPMPCNTLTATPCPSLIRPSSRCSVPRKLWLKRSASLRASASTCCARGVKLLMDSSLILET